MSLCRLLSIWGWDAWDASVRWVRHQSTPTLKVIRGTRWYWWRGCPCFLSFVTLQASDDGKWATQRTVISVFNTQLSAVMSHCLARILLRYDAEFTPQRPFSWFRELRFPAFVCIAVRRAGLTLMMSSHPCAAVCGWLFDVIDTDVKLWYLTRNSWTDISENSFHLSSYLDATQRTKGKASFSTIMSCNKFRKNNNNKKKQGP